jgi:hypothetical protein
MVSTTHFAVVSCGNDSLANKALKMTGLYGLNQSSGPQPQLAADNAR